MGDYQLNLVRQKRISTTILQKKLFLPFFVISISLVVVLSGGMYSIVRYNFV